MRKSAKKLPRGASPAKKEDLKVSGRSGQIQLAKARFSEIFRLARTEEPQRITRQGRDAVVPISDEQFARPVGKSHQPKSLVQFFRESPLIGAELDLVRRRPGTRHRAMSGFSAGYQCYFRSCASWTGAPRVGMAESGR
jgi:antitoxin Phd